MIKLNPCRLCGAPPVIDRGHWCGTDKVWVRCSAGCLQSTHYCPTEEEAGEAWNAANPVEKKEEETNA